MANAPWIVIPTYNESNNIGRLCQALLNLELPGLQVLIVDDNSPDGTGNVVRELQRSEPSIHLLTRPGKEGLGRAYVAGFRFAVDQGATAIVQMDADFSHDPADIPRLLKHLETADLVLGSRYTNGISVINWPLRRLLVSLGGNMYARLITGMPYKDVTGGFKAWRAQTLQLIDFTSIKADGYGFQIITTHRAWKKGVKIQEIPIIFTERRAGQSKMSRAIVREALWLVWKLRLFG